MNDTPSLGSILSSAITTKETQDRLLAEINYLKQKLNTLLDSNIDLRDRLTLSRNLAWEKIISEQYPNISSYYETFMRQNPKLEIIAAINWTNIKRAFYSDGRIAAIKELRRQEGLGLREAKELVDLYISLTL